MHRAAAGFDEAHDHCGAVSTCRRRSRRARAGFRRPQLQIDPTQYGHTAPRLMRSRVSSIDRDLRRRSGKRPRTRRSSKDLARQAARDHLAGIELVMLVGDLPNQSEVMLDQDGVRPILSRAMRLVLQDRAALFRRQARRDSSEQQDLRVRARTRRTSSNLRWECGNVSASRRLMERRYPLKEIAAARTSAGLRQEVRADAQIVPGRHVLEDARRLKR